MSKITILLFFVAICALINQAYSASPTRAPVRAPTRAPTRVPTRKPTNKPTPFPTSRPSGRPSSRPSSRPSGKPSSRPSKKPIQQKGPEHEKNEHPEGGHNSDGGTIAGILIGLFALLGIFVGAYNHYKAKNAEANAVKQLKQEDDHGFEDDQL